MGGAFGSVAGASDRGGDAAREEEEAAISWGGLCWLGRIRANANSERQPCICCKGLDSHAFRRLRQLGCIWQKRSGKKRGSIRRWSLMTGSKSKSEVMANDEGGGYAICRVGIGRGRRIRRQPGCRRSGPREEEMVQITSTGTIWTVPEMSAMRAPACQLCAQRK